LGIVSALLKGTWYDTLIITLSTVGISVPSYVAAIFCALLFGYILGPYTGLNMQGSIYELNDIGDDVVVWKNLILPALALGVRPVSIVTQLSRSAMLDVINMNYIKTARSKGLASFKVISNHAIRNAMNPIVTSLSGWLASLLAGAFFVEKVFNYKGVGELTINALINYDIPVILACVLFIATVFVVINILTDILYVLIDPKVKIE
jgi:peptide/nickel transport system permease protein